MRSSSPKSHAIRYRQLSRRSFIAGAGAVAAVAAVGCGDDDDDGEGTPPVDTASPGVTETRAPKKGGTLTSAGSATGLHYDQHQLPGIAGDGSVYNQLFKLGPGQKVINDLAEGYENPEPNVYVFTLRQGVKFQDLPPVSGRPMTAEDVVYTIDRSRTNNPAFSNRWMWTSLASLQAVDPVTVKATFAQPFAPALYHFAAPSMGVIAREVVDQFGDLKDAKSRIGTGPFILKEARKDELVTHKRNPGYFDPALPYLDEIQSPIIPDRLGRIVALRTGQVDMIPWQSGIADIEEAKRGMSNVTVTTRPSDAVTALGFNHASGVLGDERIRQAIAFAIDHLELIRAAGGDGAGVLRGFTHPNGPPFALPESEVADFMKPDPAKSKQLLSAAGQENLQLSVTVSSTDTTALDLAAVMQQQLNKVGIKLNIDPQESATYVRKLATKTYELVWIGAWTPALDPAQQFHGSLRSDAAQNWWNAKVMEMNEIDDRQVVELDPAKRALIVQDMERLNFRKVIALPLYVLNGWIAMKDYVKDYDHMRAFNALGWQNSLTWLDK